MKKNQWFFKLMIFIATLSLILVALAPVVAVLAPQVNPPETTLPETDTSQVEVPADTDSSADLSAEQ